MIIPQKTPPEQPLEPPSLVFDDAAADARWATPDQLASGVDLLKSIADDPEADPFETYNAQERLRAFEREISRRNRVARLSAGTSTANDRTYEAWTALARAVRERVEVPQIIQLAGIPMTRTGTSRGRDEWHGPCAVCGGDDRLIAWSGPSGRLWCRKCGWSGDVIAAASLIVKTGSFRDCVGWLAEYVGLEVPEQATRHNIIPHIETPTPFMVGNLLEGVHKSPRRGGNHPFEYRHGQVVRR